MYLDAHTHLAKYHEDSELPAALEEIEKNKILSISNSMDVLSYEKNLKIAETCKFVLPTFGIHPWSATEYSHKLQSIIELIDKTPIIGEIGLDFHFVRNKGKYPNQIQVFEFFLEAAREKDKIVIIHSYGAEEEVLKHLKNYEVKRPVLHWYAGPLKYVDEFLALGAYFTIGVDIFENKHIEKLVKQVPTERILTETDNPGAIKWLKNETGMPKLIKPVVRKLGEVLEKSPEDISQLVLNNFYSLISDDTHIPKKIKSRIKKSLQPKVMDD